MTVEVLLSLIVAPLLGLAIASWISWMKYHD